MKKIYKILLISFIVVLLDQLSKIIVRASLNVNYSIKIIGRFFNIGNTGCSVNQSWRECQILCHINAFNRGNAMFNIQVPAYEPCPDMR